ncbi:MAG: thioredoxin domain-containing protein [Verrucomicrobiota bacterium]
MSQKTRNVETVTDYNMLVNQTEKPVVIDFWAPWCGPCQALGQILEVAANQLGDEAIVAKVNVDELHELARENSISSIPTLLYYAGGKIQHREGGIPQAEAIVSKVNTLSATA